MARLLGDILVEQSACSREQLFEGLRKAAELVSTAGYRPIGEIMISLGYVTKEQLEAALKTQANEDVEDSEARADL